MNVKALVLGLALAGFSTVGAHAVTIFPLSPDALGLDADNSKAPDFRAPIGGGDHQLPIMPESPGVPEPVTWAMLLVGLGGVGGVMRSARRKAAMASTAL